MIKKALFLLTSSMFLTACSSMGGQNWWHTDTQATPNSLQKSDVFEQAEEPKVSHSANTSKTNKMSQAQRITQRVIQQGKLALSEQRLLTPEGDNAYLYFQIALGRDPGNYEATQGLADIVDTYIEWAETAARQGKRASANSFIAKASRVNADDPAIKEAKQRIAQISANKVEAVQTPVSEDVYTLPKNLFALDEPVILSHLQPIIDRVEQTQGALEIHWPSDKEGRLLYQIINSRTPNFRVRAMTYRNSKHLIEIKVN